MTKNFWIDLVDFVLFETKKERVINPEEQKIVLLQKTNKKTKTCQKTNKTKNNSNNRDELDENDENHSSSSNNNNNNDDDDEEEEEDDNDDNDEDDEDDTESEDTETHELQRIKLHFKETIATNFLMNPDIDPKQSWQSIIMVMKSHHNINIQFYCPNK
jgi:hypothetical protein